MSKRPAEPPLDAILRHLLCAQEIANKRRLRAGLRKAIKEAVACCWIEKDRPK